MSKRLRALVARREKSLAAARDIVNAVGDEDVMSDEQSEQYDAHMQEVSDFTAAIDKQKAFDAEADARLGVSADDPAADAAAEVIVTGGRPAAEEDPRRGWNHFGEFAHALVAAAQPGPNRTLDERLHYGAAPTSYGNEAAGSDGGYLVPPDFASRIQTYSLENDALLPLTQNDTVSGNAMRLPVDETTPWGTDGIRAYWEGEASQGTQTKPSLEMRELRLRKLFGLVPASDELLDDSAFAASYLSRKIGDSIRYKTNDAIVNGSGSGQPKGFVQSGALVTQAAEGSQTADTIVAGNIAKMYARNVDPTRAVWLINPDSFNQIVTMTLGDQPIWTPPSEGFKGAPNGFLLGRPIYMSENCQTLGDAGDIYFVSLAWYQTITKGRGIDFATSMHLYFDYDVTAFRAIFRVDGQSVVRNPVTPPNSSVTRSPFVRLAARA